MSLIHSQGYVFIDNTRELPLVERIVALKQRIEGIENGMPLAKSQDEFDELQVKRSYFMRTVAHLKKKQAEQPLDWDEEMRDHRMSYSPTQQIQCALMNPTAYRF